MQEIISKQIDTLLLNALINSIQSQRTQYVWKDYSGYKIASKKPPEKIPYFMASSESGKPTIESCQTFSLPGSYSQRDKMYKCEQNDYFQPIIQKAIEKTGVTESLLSKNVKDNIRFKVYMKILNLEKRDRTKPIPEDEIKELEQIGRNIANSLHNVYESKGMAGALWLDRLLKDENWINHAVMKEFDKLYPRKITSEPERRAYEKYVVEREAILSKAEKKAPKKQELPDWMIKGYKHKQKSVGPKQMTLFGENPDKPINIYNQIPEYKGYRFLSHDDGKTRYNLGLYRHEEAINLFKPYIRKSIQVERLPYGFSIRASAESGKPFGPEFKPTKSLKSASKKAKKKELPDWMTTGYKSNQMTLFGELTEKGRKRLQGKVHLWGMRLYNKYKLPTDPRTKAGKDLEQLSYALADRLIAEYGPNELVIGNKISKKIQNLDWLDDQLAKQWEMMNP